MICDVGEVTERLENNQSSFSNFPSIHLRHSSFSNPSVALPMSQLILQPFRCFIYVTAHSPILLSLLLRHRLFTYVTWLAAHGYHKCTVTVVTLVNVFPVFLNSSLHLVKVYSNFSSVIKHYVNF